ncbi:MAG TPA: SDR family oxidoreductase [Planctomycetota bacterium]|nr:SDR family oxidoreductase [Planctomycetota bacterium]
MSGNAATQIQELGGLFNVSGKSVYVPGGYGGIGEAICWTMAINGARVMISGRNQQKAEKLAAEIRAAGFEAHGIAADANSVEQIRDSVETVVKTFGSVDVLVNCVGIQREQKLLEVTEEAFVEVMSANVKAAMFLGQACAKHQIKAGRGGRQIHISSVRSQLAIRGRGYSSYCTSKGALTMLVKQHAMELAPHKINVNGVAPTFVFTELVRYMLEDKEFLSSLEQRIPLGRIAKARDIAGPCLFFASPAADFITGQVLYIDGGITASQ